MERIKSELLKLHDPKCHNSFCIYASGDKLAIEIIKGTTKSRLDFFYNDVEEIIHVLDLWLRTQK